MRSANAVLYPESLSTNFKHLSISKAAMHTTYGSGLCLVEEHVSRSAGFTLKKRDFFRNFGTISLFAVAGVVRSLQSLL